MTGKTVVGLPAEQGAQQVPERAEDEDQADLVECAGCVLCQAGQGRTLDGCQQTEHDEGQVVGCGECQLVDGVGRKPKLKLPKKFDIYSPLCIEYKFSYREGGRKKTHKINFISEDPWVELKYNRKKNEFIIIRNGELGVGELYFTKKNDRTILYNKLKIEYEPPKTKFENFVLPNEFDIYCLREEQNRFSYKEIV